MSEWNETYRKILKRIAESLERQTDMEDYEREDGLFLIEAALTESAPYYEISELHSDGSTAKLDERLAAFKSGYGCWLGNVEEAFLQGLDISKRELGKPEWNEIYSDVQRWKGAYMGLKRWLLSIESTALENE